MNRSLANAIVGFLATASVWGAAQAAPFTLSVMPQFRDGLTHTLLVQLNDGHCTGFKRGEHTLITAAHCFEGGSTLEGINGKECHGGIIHNDGNDHVSVRTTCVLPGKAVTRVAPIPAIGSQVFVWGFPKDMEFQLRTGIVSGLFVDPEEECTPCVSMDINIWHGDSGGAVYDAQGRLITLVYAYHTDVRAPRVWRMAIMQPLNFTKADWEDNQ